MIVQAGWTRPKLEQQKLILFPLARECQALEGLPPSRIPYRVDGIRIHAVGLPTPPAASPQPIAAGRWPPWRSSVPNRPSSFAAAGEIALSAKLGDRSSEHPV
jgi:hypothetical protein